MNPLAQVIKQLEDHILAENGLAGAGYVRFEHEGKQAIGFPYIRSSHERFVQVLVRSLEIISCNNDSPQFLEIGCGIGTKCELARLHGFETTGLDIDARYIELARRLFPSNRFYEENALAFDYKGYDLIYYHTPLASEALMAQLEKRVLGNMTCGSLLCATQLTKNIRPNLTGNTDSNARWRESLLPVRMDDEGRLHGLQKLTDIPDLELLIGMGD
jgi:SAM-dependent methyltransferase